MAGQDDGEVIGGTWIIDSGYSNDMTRDKELFKTLENISQQMVRLGDGKKLRVANVGLHSKTRKVANSSKSNMYLNWRIIFSAWAS